MCFPRLGGGSIIRQRRTCGFRLVYALCAVCGANKDVHHLMLLRNVFPVLLSLLVGWFVNPFRDLLLVLLNFPLLYVRHSLTAIFE